jgi:large subunit ribosomal protein L24
MKLSIRKGDLIEIISGDDKGRQGKVIEVDTKNGRIRVEGINMVKRHERTRGATKPGGIIDKPAFFHRSNAMLVCPKCGQPNRVRWERRSTGHVRVCKGCDGEVG